MTVFDMLLPMLTSAARTHLYRGSKRANNLRDAILTDYNPADWEGRDHSDREPEDTEAAERVLKEALGEEYDD